MHTEVLRGLGIRHAPFLDQPHSLKLELAGKLPSLHDTPPVPSKHLTRCLRNRVQARLRKVTAEAYVFPYELLLVPVELEPLQSLVSTVVGRALSSFRWRLHLEW